MACGSDNAILTRVCESTLDQCNTSLYNDDHTESIRQIIQAFGTLLNAFPDADDKLLSTNTKDPSQFYLHSSTLLIPTFFTTIRNLDDAQYSLSGLTDICPTRTDMMKHIFHLDRLMCAIISVYSATKFWNNIIHNKPPKYDSESVTHVMLLSVANYVSHLFLFQEMIQNEKDPEQRRDWIAKLPESLAKALLCLGGTDPNIGEKDDIFFATAIYIPAIVCGLKGADEFLSNWDDPNLQEQTMRVINKLLVELDDKGVNCEFTWATDIVDWVKSTSDIDVRHVLRQCIDHFKDVNVRPWWLDRPSEMKTKMKDGASKLRVKSRSSLLNGRLGHVSNDEILTYFPLEIREKSSEGKDVMIPGQCYHVVLFKYILLDDKWIYQPDIIRVISQDMSSGLCAVKLRLLSTSEATVKRYQGRMNPLDHYLTRVRRQYVARYYATLFTKKYGSKHGKLQVPAIQHVQVFRDSKSTDIMDYFNVELISFDTFLNVRNVKNSLVDTFSHFTYQESGGTLLVVDVKGLHVQPPRFAERMAYVSDPTIHSIIVEGTDFFGETNRGFSGFRKFWTRQHRKCNPMCKDIGLVRPGNY